MGHRQKAQSGQGICLSQKEEKYKVARSIISYKNTLLAKLLRATALVLFDVAKVTFPDTFGNLNMDQTWQYLHNYFQQVDLESHLNFGNDDLTGFFASIPQDRILQAVEFCIDLYHKNNCKKANQRSLFHR